MKTTLLTNGCSWTYGGGLDKTNTIEHITDLHNNIVWPARLKKLLGYDQCVNLSEGGGSNQRICRTTFNWIMQQDPEVLKNTTAVIQWTINSRYEYYVRHDNDTDFTETAGTFEDLNPKIKKVSGARDKFSLQESQLSRWALVNNNNVLSKFEDSDHLQSVLKARGRYMTYTEIEGVYTWLTQLGFLHDLFTAHNIEYYYWFFSNEVFAYPQHIQDYMYDRFNFLEPDRRHLWNYERLGDDPHPSARGHEQIAGYISEAIAKYKNILRKP